MGGRDKAEREAAGVPARMLYGRRRGHKLKARQVALMTDRLPALRIMPHCGAPLAAFDGLTPRPEKLELEIGFGGGEHLLARAQAAPHIGFIGCEAFVNGVGKLLAAMAQARVENIRIHDGDARDLLDALPDACLDRVWLLYPDPWPKARHAKRRFMRGENLDSLFRVLKTGGGLTLASDAAAYIDWSLRAAKAHGGFCWTAARADDWRTAPPDWCGTRYEAKALAAGRVPSYLHFVRRKAAAKGTL